MDVTVAENGHEEEQLDQAEALTPTKEEDSIMERGSPSLSQKSNINRLQQRLNIRIEGSVDQFDPINDSDRSGHGSPAKVAMDKLPARAQNGKSPPGRGAGKSPATSPQPTHHHGHSAQKTHSPGASVIISKQKSQSPTSTKKSSKALAKTKAVGPNRPL